MNSKIEFAKKVKALTLDGFHVGTIDSKYSIEKLRSFHAVNSDITKFSSFECFNAAGDALKKINLSHNKLTDIPTRMSESCRGLTQIVFSHNTILRMPNNLNLL